MMAKVKTGIDAPAVPISYELVGLVFLVNAAFTKPDQGRMGIILVGLLCIIAGLVFLRTSLIGKQRIWQKLLDDVGVAPDSQALDLGCGHGAVLNQVAQRLTLPGTVTGVDLWRSRDQSKNSLAVTRANLKVWGVSDRTSLVTADMTDLPLTAEKYDLVTTSFALHNIKPAAQRKQALREATRVLKSQGALLIVDTGHHRHEYQQVLEKLDCHIVRVRRLGINGWWTGPWMASYELWAVKN
ncbi:class I SAM-dependent methyltransferase [Lactobacillus sp. ZJLC29-4]|uniref:Class I SAM-dependent methyltransferase n=2 Tax=Levilactobacillus tujiorum TaxID=2912243 RepID=A0ABX1L4Y1_9LACO|nr:class I SAM-dependent methyltransferase [Lactobacillus sp. HBUAS51387]NLR30087.1 class I SAM-dependent methyltransferase [Levilactobacillus tujiorum]